MPAATSHEDIYQKVSPASDSLKKSSAQTTTTIASSASSYLPSFMDVRLDKHQAAAAAAPTTNNKHSPATKTNHNHQSKSRATTQRPSWRSQTLNGATPATKTTCNYYRTTSPYQAGYLCDSNPANLDLLLLPFDSGYYYDNNDNHHQHNLYTNRNHHRLHKRQPPKQQQQRDTDEGDIFAASQLHCDYIEDDYLLHVMPHLSNNRADLLSNQQQHYLTIEELRSARNSCWLCGCNWQEDHVSLDCQECGGYSLSRPCPNCDGKCEQVWKRNINATHDRHKALWIGQCLLDNKSSATSAVAGSHQQQQQQQQPSSSCCSSAASSDCESEDVGGGFTGEASASNNASNNKAAPDKTTAETRTANSKHHQQGHLCVCN